MKFILCADLVLFFMQKEDKPVASKETKSSDSRSNLDEKQEKEVVTSSCYKCPYRSWVYGKKCFPCTRHILGHHVPEMEELK